MGRLKDYLLHQMLALVNTGMCIRESLPLYAGQHSCDVVCGAPSVLQDIETQFARGIDVRVEHLTDELDGGRLVGVLLLEVHDESEGSIFKGSVRGSYYDGIPDDPKSVLCEIQCSVPWVVAYQVMTLSGTGDAETPAGGSVCMRWV